MMKIHLSGAWFILLLGLVMNAICNRHRQMEVLTHEMFCRELWPLREICHWTEGFWALGKKANASGMKSRIHPRISNYWPIIWSCNTTAGLALNLLKVNNIMKTPLMTASE
jgi:hypothetical protein